MFAACTMINLHICKFPHSIVQSLFRNYAHSLRNCLNCMKCIVELHICLKHCFTLSSTHYFFQVQYDADISSFICTNVKLIVRLKKGRKMS